MLGFDFGAAVTPMLEVVNAGAESATRALRLSRDVKAFSACHMELSFVHLLADHRYCGSYECEDRAFIVSHECLPAPVRSNEIQ